MSRTARLNLWNGGDRPLEQGTITHHLLVFGKVLPIMHSIPPSPTDRLRLLDIRVQKAPFDPAIEQDELRRGAPNVGALVAFVGLMRDINADSTVTAMTLEHYPGMTERALHGVATEAADRWPLDSIRIIHRVGRLVPEEPIVLVAVTSRHRHDAFRACELLIDYLKTRAPFWKKEETAQGERWVEARDSDDQAAERWR